MQDFRNILPDNKSILNYLLWAVRPIKFTNSYNLDRPKLSPDKLKATVYYNENLRRRLKEICEENETTYSTKIILDILSEMGYAYDLPVIRLVQFTLIKLFNNTYSALYVNEHKLLTIKNNMGDAPIVFMPTHRSYCDFMLMSYVCFNYEISIPCVAAGIDFQSMWLMNEVLRKCKAFFIRRTFNDDNIYKTVFKEYLKALISYGDSPIEFFIEGTRTRSGKSMMPKLGLLGVLIEVFLSGNIPDIIFIPVNISYDRVLEETLFAYEHLGVPKPKESTMGLIKAIANLKGGYGATFMNFGDPFSVRECLNSEDYLRLDSKESVYRKVEEIAFHIIAAQQKLQIYGSVNLLALIMYNNLRTSKMPSISIKDAVLNFKWLLQLYSQFNATVIFEGSIEDALRYAINLHSSLFELTVDGFILFQACNCTVVKNDKINSTGIPFVKLQLYINPSLNLFVRSSIITTILMKNTNDSLLTEGALYEQYIFLCSLLKFEFILNDRDNQEYQKCISNLKDLEIIPRNNELTNLQLKNDYAILLYNLIHPFLIGVYLICLFLHEIYIQNICPKELAKIVQSYIAEKINVELNGYCLSLDFICNTFNSLKALKIIKCEKEQLNILSKEFLKLAVNYLDKFVTEDDITRNFDLAKKKKTTSKL